MVYYECKRCGYNTNHRNSIKNHFKRKNICKPILEDISIEEMLKQYKMENTEKMAPKQLQNGAPLLQNAPKWSNSYNLRCEYCNKIFSKKSNVTKHLQVCKIKKNKLENDELYKKDLSILKDMVEDVLLKLSNKDITLDTNTTNTTNITNITNNIQINVNAYGKENISHLSNTYITELLKGAFGAIPKLIEKIHFDPEHPENSNIKMTNKKLPHIQVKKDNIWEIEDKNTFLEALVNDKYFMLEDYIEDINIDKLAQYHKDIIDKFREKYNSDDEELLKTLKKKTELIIINKSKNI